MTERASLDSLEHTRDVILTAYRHDAHKLNGESHDSASSTFQETPVNQPVPCGADSDASALSRPSGKPEQTVANHQTHYRLSLLTGDSHYDPETFTRARHSAAVENLLTDTDPETVHRAWLTSGVAGEFNESSYYPYTSLKYHTLLVAALLDNYRDGHEFADLYLIVDGPEKIVPYRTVYAGNRFALRIDRNREKNPWARLGSRPWRSWSPTWTRLTRHPLDTDHDRHDMVLDANLRRIRSWSTALQYIGDFETRREDQ